jgi:hypothetical protein
MTHRVGRAGDPWLRVGSGLRWDLGVGGSSSIVAVWRG